jgi:hypothetical protein
MWSHDDLIALRRTLPSTPRGWQRAKLVQVFVAHVFIGHHDLPVAHGKQK